MGISSSALCTVAKDMFFAAALTIPESFFCAMSVDDGKGDSEAIGRAARAWGELSRQMREFHDELAGTVRSVPGSEWRAADREAFEREAGKYLEQVTTSAVAAETASVLLYAVEAALDVYAAFAVAEAAVLVVNAAAIAAADCTLVGAPAAEAEGLAAGGEAYAALESAAKVLVGVLTGIAVVMEAGALLDMGAQAVMGDKAALGDFGHATLTGLKADVKMLPNEALDYGKSKLLKGLHDHSFGEGSGSGGSSDGGHDSGSGNADTGHSGESGSDGHQDGSGNSEKHDWRQPVGNDPFSKQVRSFLPEAPG